MLRLGKSIEAKESLERGSQYHFCKVCKKWLRVNRVLRKRINQYTTFNIFIFYCGTCKSTFFIFKSKTNKKERI